MFAAFAGAHKAGAAVIAFMGGLFKRDYFGTVFNVQAPRIEVKGVFAVNDFGVGF